MEITLSEYELKQIETKLPPALTALKSKYPAAVTNAALNQDLPQLPEGYQPRAIDYYYGDRSELPAISWKDGEVNFLYFTDDCIDNPVLQIEVDGRWGYIEAEGQILLNRIDLIELPKIELKEAGTLKTIKLQETGNAVLG